MGKPFHELTKAEFAAYSNAGKTWQEVAAEHPQPAWCTYPDAVNGMMGCWSLVAGLVTGEDYCKGCELYRAAAREQEGQG